MLRLYTRLYSSFRPLKQSLLKRNPALITIRAKTKVKGKMTAPASNADRCIVFGKTVNCEPTAVNGYQCSMINDKCSGFTLIEVVVVVAIILFLSAILYSRFGAAGKKAAVICALNEMTEIKKAIRDHFYLDLGLIPEDLGPDGLPDSGDENPHYAGRYLCLANDGAGNPQQKEMEKFLVNQSASTDFLEWDKYNRRGWRGPYMEADGSCSAEEYGQEATFFPLIAVPWIDACEAKAREEEALGEINKAKEYRKGKYYHIIVEHEGEKQLKDTARIVCFGRNCLDDGSLFNGEKGHFTTKDDLKEESYDTGDDMVMFVFGTHPSRFPEGFNTEDWGY